MFSGTIDSEKFALAVVEANRQSGNNSEIVANSIELYQKAYEEADKLKKSKPLPKAKITPKPCYL